MRKVVLLFLVSMLYQTCSALPAFSGSFPGVDGIEILTRLPDAPDISSDVLQVPPHYFAGPVPVPDGVVRHMALGETLWIRVPAAALKEFADSFPGKDAVLVMDNEHLSHVECFAPDGAGGPRRRLGGSDVSANGKNMPSRFPAFLLESSDLKGDAWLSVRSDFPVSFRVAVQDEKTFYESFIDRLTAETAFFGFMAALTLLFFLLCLLTGSGDHILVALRQFAAFGFFFVFSRYPEYYFDASAHAVYVSAWFFLGMHCVASAFLSGSMLHMDAERYGRWLAYFQTFVSVLMICSAAAGYTLPTLCLVSVLLAVELLWSMGVGILRLRQGYRRILPFVFSRLAFIAGMAFLALNVFSPWSERAPEGFSMICFLLDPVLLAGMMISGTRERLGNYIFLGEKNIRCEKISQRDEMTGLFNKAHFLSLLPDRMRAAKRDGKDLAFMMLDIDHFKKFNDRWGYPEGDRMLCLLSEVVRRSLRESDIAVRCGGDELCVILPGGTLPTSILVAERIRKTFEKESTSPGAREETTVSVGLSFLTPNDTITTLIQRANDALWRAKSNGRNRTEFEVTE